MAQTKTSIGRDFQDNMLRRLAEAGLTTTIYLRNRMSLRGRIVDFDPYVLVLEPRDGTPVQMVYKSAIVSISGPPRPYDDRPYERRPYEGRPYEGRPHEGRPYEGRPHEGRAYEGRPPDEEGPPAGDAPASDGPPDA